MPIWDRKTRLWVPLMKSELRLAHGSHKPQNLHKACEIGWCVFERHIKFPILMQIRHVSSTSNSIYPSKGSLSQHAEYLDVFLDHSWRAKVMMTVPMHVVTAPRYFAIIGSEYDSETAVRGILDSFDNQYLSSVAVWENTIAFAASPFPPPFLFTHDASFKLSLSSVFS